MEIFCICRQRYEEDGVTKSGKVEALTIDNGWTEYWDEHPDWSAIFRQNHAEYIVEKLQLKSKNQPVKFFTKELSNA